MLDVAGSFNCSFLSHNDELDGLLKKINLGYFWLVVERLNILRYVRAYFAATAIRLKACADS